MLRVAARCAFILALLATAGADVSGQFVSGKVIRAGTEEPLDAVRVELRTAQGRSMAEAVTDTAGRFILQAPRTGEYMLVAEHIGMQTVSSPLEVVVSERVEVILRMSETAVPLEPVTVEARSRMNIGPLAGYYDRIDRNQRAGIGHIITRDRIVARSPFNVSDLLREVPRVSIVGARGRGGEVWMRGGAGGCAPRVFIDGMLSNRRGPASVDDLVHPLDLEGVEVYQGFSQLPGEFHDPSGCGVILLWTRRTSDPGSPMTWKRFVAGAVAAGLLLLLTR